MIWGLSLLLVMSCGEKKQTSESDVSTTQTETPAVTGNEAFVVKPRQMGKAKIGMKKADFWKAYPNAKEGVVMIEGEIPSWDVQDTDGKMLFHATHDSDTVMFLITENTKFQTAEGIKIGDTYEKLAAAYPDIKLTFAEGYLANSAAKRLSFFLEGDIKAEHGDDGTLKDIKVGKDVKVRDISTQ